MHHSCTLNKSNVNNQRDFWLEVQKRVVGSDPMALLCVVESVGSSPGRKGFKMCLPIGSELVGTIGGGIMEKKLIDLTADLLDREGSFPFLKRQVHQADIGKDRSGMICSGEQTVAGYFLYGQEAIDLVSNIIAAFDERDRARELEFSTTGIRLIPAGERRALGPDEWCYYEVLRDRPSLAIVGAGHVSLALSRQMDLLGFRVIVYDDRNGLHTWHANTFAQEKHVVDYARMTEHLPDDPELYVVIASVGYRTDDLILRQLIHHRYKYLGLLGSAEKVRVMFEAMRNDGFPAEVLARVHAPIGLPVHSRTPEEIAVSIAAEIIGVKNA